MIKVAIPKTIRTRLNMRHRIAPHHITGLVRRGRGCLNIGGLLNFLLSEFDVSAEELCGFLACFDITI